MDCDSGLEQGPTHVEQFDDRRAGAGQRGNKETSPQVQLSVDHRFLRSDQLGYWIFVYNAKRNAAGAIDLVAETQVLRDGKVVLNNRSKLNNDSADRERIPYGAALALQSLSPGSYELRVKIVDAVGNADATQSIDFVVQ